MSFGGNIVSITQSASNIWQLQSQDNVQGILETLEDAESVVVRRRALRALRQMEAQQGLSKLRELRDQEPYPELFQLFNTVIKLFDPSDIAPKFSETSYRSSLIDWLHGDDTEKAIDAAQKLGEINDKLAVEHLVMVFQDRFNTPALRLAAAESLIKLNSAPASASLLVALRKDDWQVRRNAAAILGQLQARWAVQPLIDVMRHDVNPTVRKTAAAALRVIKSTQALAALDTGKLSL